MKKAIDRHKTTLVDSIYGNNVNALAQSTCSIIVDPPVNLKQLIKHTAGINYRYKRNRETEGNRTKAYVPNKYLI